MPIKYYSVLIYLLSIRHCSGTGTSPILTGKAIRINKNESFLPEDCSARRRMTRPLPTCRNTETKSQSTDTSICVEIIKHKLTFML